MKVTNFAFIRHYKFICSDGLKSSKWFIKLSPSSIVVESNTNYERFLKDDDGMLITTEKWRNYFDRLLNCEEPTEKFPFNIENLNTQECPHPKLEKIGN